MRSVNEYPTVQLSEVLVQDQHYITEPEPRSYSKLSVQLYGRGVALDAPTDGSSVRMKRHQLAKAGQVILSEIWAKKGAIGIVPPEGDGALITSHFFLFDILETRLLPLYMKWLLKGNYFAHALDNEARGTTGYAAIRPRQFLAMTIPLPPLAEQQRIVARIEALAGKIEAARRLRGEAAEETVVLRASVLRRMRISLLADNYHTADLGNLTTVTSGGTPSRNVGEYWAEGQIPWIKTAELLDKDIFRAEEHITEAGLNNSSAKIFPPETVLIALYGQGQTRGRTGRLRIPAATNQACCAILPVPDLLNSRYVQYWLRSHYYEMRTESHGGAQPNWKVAMIKNIRIALLPLPAQQSIVDYLDRVLDTISAASDVQSKTRYELDALLPALLDRAFRGEL